MIEGEVSQTALHVAASRAAHLRFDPAPHILEDAYAEALLGEQLEKLLPMYSDEGGLWLLRENRLFIPLRARFGEDRIRESYQEGVRQAVVLGAGLDSFAFRRPAELAELTVFEVDHPSTQGWKTARVAELGWSVPDHLRFVPCDFERESVALALAGSGFDTAAPAVVTWMGVTYYLAPETVRQALVSLRSVLAPGSEVVLDYQFPVEDLSPRYREIHAGMNSYLNETGEPQQTRYRAPQLREVILAAGYSEALMVTREQIYRRYFAPLDTKIPMTERFGLAVARR